MRWVLIRNPWTRAKNGIRRLNVWHRSSRVARRLGAERTAVRLLERALEAQPDRGDLHLDAARYCLKMGQLEKAAWHCRRANLLIDENFIQWLERACREDDGAVIGDRFAALGALGNWYFQTGDFEKAIEYYSRALSGGRIDATVLNNKGLCLLHLDRDQEALSLFQQALAQRTTPEILVNTGLALNRLRRYPEALSCYEKAQRKNHSSLELLINKGYALFHLKRYDEAVVCFEMAQAVTPQDTVVLNNLAACYLKLGRFEAAAACYRTALESAPHDAALHNNYGLCLERQRQYAEALNHYERALELDDKERETFLANKAQCLVRLGRHEEANAICDRLLQEAPENRLYWGLKADVLAAAGAEDQAIDFYNRALGLTG